MLTSRISSCLRAIVAAVTLPAAVSLAGIGPENVAVVVNGDSWASLAVANEYARLRRIPPSNFIVLGGISSIDQTDVERFRSEILLPVFAALDARGLTAQIDCIAYSCDIPYAASVRPDTAGKQFPQVITGVASANGLTYLHEWVRKKDTDYLRLDINRYTRRAMPLTMSTPLSAADQAEYRRGMTLYDAKKYDEAAAVIAALDPDSRGDPGMFYNLACCQALAGRADDAMSSLRAAAAMGWRNHGQTTSDPDLKSLADRGDFKKLISDMKSAVVEVQPTRGFRSRYAWNQAGEPADTGPRYMLSTMLGVTCGRGNSVSEVLDSLRRAAGADGDAHPGTIYFLENGDVRSATRDWAFPSAMAQLRSLGIRCVTEAGVLPQGKKDVAGAVIGIADFDWTRSGSAILPGAICEHLTSLGGIIAERGGQTPCTEFIRAGAAGTSGTVTEPYALQEKFPTAFMHLHYARGSTLAESFYQSLYGPYQLLIIGDPLCRPWGKTARVSAPGLAAGAALSGVQEFRPAATGSGSPIGTFEMYVDGRFIGAAAPGAPMKLDTGELPDGHHDLAIVGVESSALEARSRVSVPVLVKNRGRELTLTRKPPARTDYGKKFTVGVACPSAASIELLHLGRAVGRCDGPGGTIEVDTASLGTGRVALHPVAHSASGKATDDVLGAPIEVLIAPPAARAPSPAPGKSQRGLALRIAGGSPVPVSDTMSGDWLAKTGIQPGQPFELSGTFDAPEADLYQVQLRTNTGAKVEIDSAELLAAENGAWRFAPVSLRPGVHRLRITGTAPANPSLDIRIGAKGAYHPSAERFQFSAR